MLSFNGYSKHYNGNLILQAPALELGHGIYWLKGENGSGKTTLIKSIAGLIPFDGEISVDGVAINKQRAAYRLLVNYAEAEPAYPNFLTGDDLIRFYATTKKAGSAQVQALTAVLGVTAFSGNKIGTYSSGMAKKLSLVLGLMGQPRLILLDEPLITLDQASVAVLQGIIESYYKQGITFLITSHQEIHFGSQASARLGIKDKVLALL